eukprot:gene12324-8455_t
MLRISRSFRHVVRVNAGGQVFETRLQTLQRFPDTLFASLFATLTARPGDAGASARAGSAGGPQSRTTTSTASSGPSPDVFLDVSPRVFERVLQFLRTSRLVLPGAEDLCLRGDLVHQLREWELLPHAFAAQAAGSGAADDAGTDGGNLEAEAEVGTLVRLPDVCAVQLLDTMSLEAGVRRHALTITYGADGFHLRDLTRRIREDLQPLLSSTYWQVHQTGERSIFFATTRVADGAAALLTTSLQQQVLEHTEHLGYTLMNSQMTISQDPVHVSVRLWAHQLLFRRARISAGLDARDVDEFEDQVGASGPETEATFANVEPAGRHVGPAPRFHTDEWFPPGEDRSADFSHWPRHAGPGYLQSWVCGWVWELGPQQTKIVAMNSGREEEKSSRITCDKRAALNNFFCRVGLGAHLIAILLEKPRRMRYQHHPPHVTPELSVQRGSGLVHHLTVGSLVMRGGEGAGRFVSTREIGGRIRLVRSGVGENPRASLCRASMMMMMMMIVLPSLYDLAPWRMGWVGGRAVTGGWSSAPSSPLPFSHSSSRLVTAARVTLLSALISPPSPVRDDCFVAGLRLRFLASVHTPIKCRIKSRIRWTIRLLSPRAVPSRVVPGPAHTHGQRRWPHCWGPACLAPDVGDVNAGPPTPAGGVSNEGESATADISAQTILKHEYFHLPRGVRRGTLAFSGHTLEDFDLLRSACQMAIMVVAGSQCAPQASDAATLRLRHICAAVLENTIHPPTERVAAIGPDAPSDHGLLCEHHRCELVCPPNAVVGETGGCCCCCRWYAASAHRHTADTDTTGCDPALLLAVRCCVRDGADIMTTVCGHGVAGGLEAAAAALVQPSPGPGHATQGRGGGRSALLPCLLDALIAAVLDEEVQPEPASARATPVPRLRRSLRLLDILCGCLTPEHTGRGSSEWRDQRVAGRRSIDFTAAKFLLGCCESALPCWYTTALFQCVRYRLERHPGDLVDWAKGVWPPRQPRPGREEGLLELAAGNQRLHAVWPAVCGQAHFDDRTAAIRLDGAALWAWDWEALGQVAQRALAADDEHHETNAAIEATRATGLLMDLMTRRCGRTHIPPEPVRRCVAAGADVMFRGPHRRSPLLVELAFTGEIAALTACLQAARSPLDFAAGVDVDGWTALHAACYAGAADAGRTKVAATLGALLRRLLPSSGGGVAADEVEWLQRSRSGYSMFCVAAHSGCLALVWEMITTAGVVPLGDGAPLGTCRPVDGKGRLLGRDSTRWIPVPIRLTLRVQRQDWEAVKGEHQRPPSFSHIHTHTLLCILDLYLHIDGPSLSFETKQQQQQQQNSPTRLMFEWGSLSLETTRNNRHHQKNGLFQTLNERICIVLSSVSFDVDGALLSHLISPSVFFFSFFLFFFCLIILFRQVIGPHTKPLHYKPLFTHFFFFFIPTLYTPLIKALYLFVIFDSFLVHPELFSSLLRSRRGLKPHPLTLYYFYQHSTILFTLLYVDDFIVFWSRNDQNKYKKRGTHTHLHTQEEINHILRLPVDRTPPSLSLSHCVIPTHTNMALSRRLSQAIETIPSELQGTVDRKSTEEQRQVFLERIYADYAELQLQNDEVLERKWKVDADVYNSNKKEIHDILFGGTDGQESDMGDWDTWERVEMIIKHCVYSRPSNFSQRRQMLQSQKDRIDLLNKALITQRQRITALNLNLNSQLEELSGLKNLLLLKEREICTLRNQNTTFSLQIRHAKREVSRIRGTRLMVEQDELMQDFQLLLEANKELEKDNVALRAKLHAKYGMAELKAMQEGQEAEQRREQRRFEAKYRPKHRGHHRRRRPGEEEEEGGEVHFLSMDQAGGKGSWSSFGSGSSSSSDSSSFIDSFGDSFDGVGGGPSSVPGADGQPLERGAGRRHRRKPATLKTVKKVKKIMKRIAKPEAITSNGTEGAGSSESTNPLPRASTMSGVEKSSGAFNNDVSTAASPFPEETEEGGEEAFEECEEEVEELEEVEEGAESRTERRLRRRAKRLREQREAAAREAEEANIKAYHGMLEALSSDQQRGAVLSSNVPVSSVLIRMKKRNLALKRRIELEVGNIMNHLDFDAGATFAGPGAAIAFTVPTFAFESGPFTTFEGFRTKEEALTVLAPQKVEQAPPSGRGSIISMASLASMTSTTAVLPQGHHRCSSTKSGEKGSPSSNLSPVPVPAPPPLPPKAPPSMVELVDMPKAIGIQKIPSSHRVSTSSMRTDEGRSGGSAGLAFGNVSDHRGLSTVHSMHSDIPSTATSRRSDVNFPICNTQRSWNALKHGILGIAQLSRAECLKREALHILQLRQKLSYQQKQIDHLMLNPGGGLTGKEMLSETRIPKFTSTGFGDSFSSSVDTEEEGAEEPQHDGSYVMQDTLLSSSSVPSNTEGFSVVLGDTSLLEGGHRRSTITEMINAYDSPLGLPQKGSISIASPLHRHHEVRREKRISVAAPPASSDEDDGMASDESGSPRTGTVPPGESATVEDGAGGEKKKQTIGGSAPESPPDPSGKPLPPRRGRSKNRSVVIQETTADDWDRRYHNVVYENTDAPTLIGTSEKLLRHSTSGMPSSGEFGSGMVIQGHRLQVGDKRHDSGPAATTCGSTSMRSVLFHYRRGSRDTAGGEDEIEWSGTYKSSPPSALQQLQLLSQKYGFGKSMLRELKDMKDGMKALREQQTALRSEIQAFIRLLETLFGSMEALVERRLRHRLEALAASPPDTAGGESAALTLQFLREATEARVRDVLHHEHGILLPEAEQSEEGEAGARGQQGRRKDPHRMTDAEWVADQLQRTALGKATSKILEDHDAFVPPETFRYYVGEGKGLAPGEERDAAAAAADGMDHPPPPSTSLEGRRGVVVQPSRRKGRGPATAAEFARLFHEMLTGADSGACLVPLADDRSPGSGGGFPVDPEHNCTSDDLLRAMFLSGMGVGQRGGPRQAPSFVQDGAAPNREGGRQVHLPDGALEWDGGDDTDSVVGGYDADGKLRRPFHGVVRGRRIASWNPPHPFASLFPALFFDQETTMGGGWYHIPIGAHQPQVLEEAAPTPSGPGGGGGSPSRHAIFRTADSTRAIAQLLREMQPPVDHTLALLRPTVRCYQPQRQAEAKAQLNRSLRNLFGDEFNTFLRQYILPIASTAKRFAASMQRLDPSLLSAVRQLRQEEEARRQRRVGLLFRRVATNIRSRLMLRRPVYQGRMAEEEEEWAAHHQDTGERLLAVLDLEDPAQAGSFDGSATGRTPLPPARPGGAGGTPHQHRGYFKDEPSSFHFDRARLPERAVLVPHSGPVRLVRRPAPQRPPAQGNEDTPGDGGNQVVPLTSIDVSISSATNQSAVLSPPHHDGDVRRSTARWMEFLFFSKVVPTELLSSMLMAIISSLPVRLHIRSFISLSLGRVCRLFPRTRVPRRLTDKRTINLLLVFLSIEGESTARLLAMGCNNSSTKPVDEKEGVDKRDSGSGLTADRNWIGRCATRELQRLCGGGAAAPFTPCQLERLRRCVAAGGDVTARVSEDVHCSTILLHLLRLCCIGPDSSFLEAWRICLQTTRSIDFRVNTDEYGATPLMLLSLAPPPRAAEVLDAVLERWSSSRGRLDDVDWRQRDQDGLDAVSWYAQHGLLGVCLSRLLARCPLFAAAYKGGAAEGGMLVLAPAFPLDLARLKLEERCLLRLPKGWWTPLQAVCEISTWSFQQPQIVLPSVVGRYLRDAAIDNQPEPSSPPPMADEKQLLIESLVHFAHAYADTGDQKMLECTTLCLTVPWSLDFSCEAASLVRLMCEAHEPEAGVELVRQLARRLAVHPEDIFEWGEQFGERESERYDLLSLAAQRGRLALLWPVLLEQVPYFHRGGGVTPLFFAQPLPWDWAAIPPAQRRFLGPRCGILSLAEAAAALQHTPCSAEELTARVAALCAAGLDVGAYLPASPTMGEATGLYTVFRLGAHSAKALAAAVAGCARPLNYMKLVVLDGSRSRHRRRSDGGGGFFFCFLREWRRVGYSRDDVRLVFSSMAVRLRTHPLDMVDWSARDECGLDLLSCMAAVGVLSIWYGVAQVSRVPPCCSSVPGKGEGRTRFAIRVPVRILELRRMADAEAVLDLTAGILSPSQELLLLAQENEDPNFTDVDALIGCGAAPDAPEGGGEGPDHRTEASLLAAPGGCALLTLAFHQHSHCVMQCLERCGEHLDLRVVNSRDEGLPHLVCGWQDVEAAAQALRRLAAVEPGDRVNWLQKDKKGRYSWNVLAEAGHLTLLWPIVKRRVLAQLQESRLCTTSLLVLRDPPLLLDWELLDPTDQRRFHTT